MALERKILTIKKPTMLIDQMDQASTDDGKGPFLSDSSKYKQSGVIWPLIEINDYQFNENEVESMMLDETGFIPKLRISVQIIGGTFISKHFPKDGDPLSLFIRSKKDEFKPIRADFDITLINASPSSSSSGDVQSFIIEGTLRIPGLYAEWCKSFKNKTSYDALIDVCTELKVGFASNEVSTTDKMNWICAFDTYQKFINDISMAAYKDDDSFFKSYFDHHYYLNFVNMNNQFSDEFELEDSLEDLSFSDDFFQDKKITNIDTSILLCNHRNFRASGNHIYGYTLVNKAGQVVIDNGYRRYLQHYTSTLNSVKPSEKYNSYFVEPLNTKDTKNKILLKGRLNEDFFSKHNKYKWLGVESDIAKKGNMHKNFLHAFVQNRQNTEEIEKMMLRVNLGKCNFNLYRGQRVPVIIVNDTDVARQQATLDPSQKADDKLSFDKFLSGYYIIHSMKYHWSNTDGKFTQELFLSRREWAIPEY